MRTIAARVGGSLVLLLAVSVLSFALLEMAPGDYFAEMRADTRVAPETIDALRTQYGLTESPAVRYLRWVESAIRGDMGFSLAHRAPVSSLLWARAGNTLLLTIPAMVLTWCVALPLGAWIARRPGEWPDRVCSGATSALVALPDLLVVLLLLLLALRTGLFPTGGMQAIGSEDLRFDERLRDVASHAFLPVCALIASTLPSIVRHVRAGFIDAAAAPAVQAARAHGLSPSAITWRYALPLAANPLISLAGLSLATLLSASLLIEVVMSWPGLGPLLLEAVLARDVHVVLAVSMLATTMLVVGNLASELALHAVDPRIRA